MVSLALTLCREGGDITPLKAGSAFTNSAARAVVQGATLEQLEALGMFARCSEWQAAVLGRLSCSGVDEAELAQWSQVAWEGYYKRLEVSFSRGLCFL